MNRQRPSLRELAEYFVRLGATGFGGPIALVGYMERDIVERRQWVTRQEFSDGLAFSQLAPGPLAAQLAIYLGWLCRGARGATAVGIAFIMPSFLMVVALAALYLRLGGMAWLRGAFYGVGAAVIAIIAKSSVKLARSTLGRDWLMWALFATSAVVTAWRESEVVWLFVASGVVALVLRTASASSSRQAWSVAALWLGRRPDWLDGGVQGVASLSIAGSLFLYFTAAGMFVFGSGLAIVPFLHGGVVQEHQWLTERQFLDAVAVALITPGPVVITVAFIGYLVAGALGAIAAAAGVFAPVYVITLLLAPHFERFKADTRVRAFVDGVTAAATGAIAGAAYVLGRRAIVDLTTALIGAGALGVFLMRRKVPEPVVIAAAGVVGVLAASS